MAVYNPVSVTYVHVWPAACWRDRQNKKADDEAQIRLKYLPPWVNVPTDWTNNSLNLD